MNFLLKASLKLFNNFNYDKFSECVSEQH